MKNFHYLPIITMLFFLQACWGSYGYDFAEPDYGWDRPNRCSIDNGRAFRKRRRGRVDFTSRDGREKCSVSWRERRDEHSSDREEPSSRRDRNRGKRRGFPRKRTCDQELPCSKKDRPSGRKEKPTEPKEPEPTEPPKTEPKTTQGTLVVHFVSREDLCKDVVHQVKIEITSQEHSSYTKTELLECENLQFTTKLDVGAYKVKVSYLNDANINLFPSEPVQAVSISDSKKTLLKTTHGH